MSKTTKVNGDNVAEPEVIEVVKPLDPTLAPVFPKGLDVVGVSDGSPSGDGLIFAYDAGIVYDHVNAGVTEKPGPGFRYKLRPAIIAGTLNADGILEQPVSVGKSATFINTWHEPGLPLVRASTGFRIALDTHLNEFVLLRELEVEKV